VNGLGNWAVFACLEKGAKASANCMPRRRLLHFHR
jgi:hypothetical protein